MGVHDGRLLKYPIKVYYGQSTLLLGGNMQDEHSKVGQNQTHSGCALKG
jgi:hypothetical protein